MLYRVRPLNDKIERVVAEADLTPSIAGRPETHSSVRPFTIAINRR